MESLMRELKGFWLQIWNCKRRTARRTEQLFICCCRWLHRLNSALHWTSIIQSLLELTLSLFASFTPENETFWINCCKFPARNSIERNSTAASVCVSNYNWFVLRGERERVERTFCDEGGENGTARNSIVFLFKQRLTKLSPIFSDFDFHSRWCIHSTLCTAPSLPPPASP